MPYGDGILESPADRYGKTTVCMRNAKRIFKCAAYVVYFVGVLVFAVASKGSFLLMTQSLGNRLQVRFFFVEVKLKILFYFLLFRKEKQYASRWSFMLVATICVPYVFLFLEALAKSLFRNRRGPVFTDLITVNEFQSTRISRKIDFCFCFLFRYFFLRVFIHLVFVYSSFVFCQVVMSYVVSY